MNFASWLLIAISGPLVAFALASHFSNSARNLRKRRRNYGRVASKARRPMVTLAVKLHRA